MWLTILLAVLSGGALGFVIERGDFCFHSTWRGVFRWPRDLDLMRAYWLSLLVGIPLVQGLIASNSIEPWVPPFVPAANLVGGVIFGVGMVAAASCVTGLFYKLGHGMLGTLVGLLFWAAGDVLTYLGPLSSLRESLNTSALTVDGENATLLNLFGPAGFAVLVGLAIVAILYLWRSPQAHREKLWGWLPLGLAVGGIISLAWLMAEAGGTDYPYGTSGVPAGVIQALAGDSGIGSPWIPVALASLVPGAFIGAWSSGTLWVRGETARRYAGLALGGFLMGVGAAIAGGCNLGHSLVGVPLLSMGSITTTLAMGVGVFLADRFVKLRPLTASRRAKGSA